MKDRLMWCLYPIIGAKMKTGARYSKNWRGPSCRFDMVGVRDQRDLG